jgi:hypothetical protein
MFSTYDHNLQNTRDPVRSPIDKLASAGLVVGSVTTSESPVLYVDFVLFSFVVVLYDGQIRCPTTGGALSRDVLE